MRTEFLLLGGLLILALVQILAAAQARTAQLGVKWNMGPRDAEPPPPNPLAGRLQRAQANLMETLPLFVAALLGAAAAGHLGWKTLLGAQLFFWARLLYVPIYAAGIPMLRSLVWLVSVLGLAFEIWALVLG